MGAASSFDTPALYQILLKEQLGQNAGEWFSDFTISRDTGGGTLLSGVIVDQASLHGVIRKARDLGLTLVSVQRVDTRRKEGDAK